METKDWLILALSVPAGLVTLWLGQALSTFTKFGFKQIRFGRFSVERERFVRVSSLKGSAYVTSFIVIECTYSLAMFVSGLIFMSVAISKLSWHSEFYSETHPISQSVVLSLMLFVVGMVGFLAGAIRFRRVTGDVSRLMQYDAYVASFDKQKAELFPQSKTTP